MVLRHKGQRIGARWQSYQAWRNAKARAALLKTAAISGVYVRMNQADNEVAFEVPETNAECKEISLTHSTHASNDLVPVDWRIILDRFG
jgi:hypothetical protein